MMPTSVGIWKNTGKNQYFALGSEKVLIVLTEYRLHKDLRQGSGNDGNIGAEPAIGEFVRRAIQQVSRTCS